MLFRSNFLARINFLYFCFGNFYKSFSFYFGFLILYLIFLCSKNQPFFFILSTNYSSFFLLKLCNNNFFPLIFLDKKKSGLHYCYLIKNHPLLTGSNYFFFANLNLILIILSLIHFLNLLPSKYPEL